MSLFQNMFGIGGDASSSTADPAPAPAAVGDTESVRRIAARLGTLPPERARFVAAFAYLLARAANTDMQVSDGESSEMARQIAEIGELDEDTAGLVVAIAGTRVEQYGATDDFLVTREFKAISTPDDREHLLRCLLLVAASDDEITARESWLVNRVAEELDIPRADLNRIRDEFTDKIAGLADLRRMRAATETAAPAAAPAEIPEGLRIEQIWLVEVPLTPDGPRLRSQFRHQHLSRMMRLKVQNRIIEAGATADLAKSVLLVRAASEDEIRELVAEDPYTAGGVWGEPIIVGLGRIVLGD